MIAGNGKAIERASCTNNHFDFQFQSAKDNRCLHVCGQTCLCSVYTFMLLRSSPYCAKRCCPEGLTEFQVNPALYVVFLAGTYRYENRL